MTKITKKDVCPNCGSSDYTRGMYEDDGFIWFPCECNGCGASFANVYKFYRNEMEVEK